MALPSIEASNSSSGRSPSWSRSPFGMTMRPTPSMVTFIAGNLPLNSQSILSVCSASAHDCRRGTAEERHSPFNMAVGGSIDSEAVDAECEVSSQAFAHGVWMTEPEVARDVRAGAGTVW